MEFFDEDRPRFVFQTRASQKSHPDPIESTEKPNKIFISVSIVVSLVFVAVSLFYIELEPLKSLLLWLSLSLLVGPFAPSSFTGGSIRVGHGPIIEEEQIDQQQGEIDREPRRKQIQKRSKPQIPDYPPEKPGAVVGNANNSSRKTDQSQNPNVSVNASVKSEESGDWCEEDVEILKKQLVKNPAGKPGRWESVASAFGGRYRVESVIKKAKELGEKKTNENDDYSLFLKNRKPVDARSVEDKTGGSEMGEDDGKKGSWSNGEDIALLNALKVFPKDAPMRWEKIAAAVPGKTKAACMKRVTDMKKDFRSSKAGGESH